MTEDELEKRLAGWRPAAPDPGVRRRIGEALKEAGRTARPPVGLGVRRWLGAGAAGVLAAAGLLWAAAVWRGLPGAAIPATRVRVAAAARGEVLSVAAGRAALAQDFDAVIRLVDASRGRGSARPVAVLSVFPPSKFEESL